MQGDAPSARQWRPSAFWIAVAICFAIVSFGSNLLEIRYAYINSASAGDWGFTFTQPGPDTVVQSVEPGSKAAAIGITPGDRLRSDEPFLFRNIPLTGETLRFTRVAPGPPMAMSLVAPRADPPPMVVPNPLDRLLDDSVRMLVCFGGLFILWRGSSRRSGFLLGLAFLAMSPFPAQWLPLSPYAYLAWTLGFGALVYSEYGLFLPLFAMAFLTESRVAVPRWARPFFWTGAAATLFCYIFIEVLPPGLSSASSVASRARVPLTIAIFVLTMTLLGVGWRRGTAESRHRFALLLLAVGLIFLSGMLFVMSDLSHADPRALTDSSTLLRILGSSLFAYAVLRHKVIDVGFTLNRTLVYGGVSAILLAAFGLAEWAMHQVLALEGWEGSALVSAGLAVAVFLAFHPVRAFVEHYVSAIFFRPWRTKEQALRKFVHEAVFFSDSARLAAAFAGALEQFSGACCCVYRRAEDRSFVCATGKMPAAHADDATAVALRAEPKVCEIESGKSVVEGVLAFPMIHCHDLEGFAVLGVKSDAERYRPDEIELVEWATRQVGQDLYGLSVDQLRAEREERDREIAVLTGRNADLQLALANRISPARLRRVSAKGAVA